MFHNARIRKEIRKSIGLCLVMAVLLSVIAVCPAYAENTPATPVYRDPNQSLEVRVKAILDKMTDAQILAVGSGRGLPSITLPGDSVPLPGLGNGYVEALHGSSKDARATMYPQAIGFGNTWDSDLMKTIGNAIGTEVRGKAGANNPTLKVWAPVQDVRLNPLAGRFEEGYGEDPFLCGTIGTAYSFGLQGRVGDNANSFYMQTLPQMKHSFGYDFEWNRLRDSASMSARAMYEDRLVSYQMPIEADAVNGAMTSYNLINGIPGIIHPENEILRKFAPINYINCPDANDAIVLNKGKGAPYVFPTLVVPQNAEVPFAKAFTNTDDPNVNGPYSSVLMAATGMSNFDQSGYPGATGYYNRAINNGTLGMTVDDAKRVVADWYRYLIRTGMVDSDAWPNKIPKDSNPQNQQANKDLALKTAEEQVVLLKNSDNLLPLKQNSINKLAVVGPLADQNLADYYSPRPAFADRINPLQGLQALLGSDKVDFANGCDTVALQSVPYGTFITSATGNNQANADYTAYATPMTGGYQLSNGKYVSKNQAWQLYDWGYDQWNLKSVGRDNYYMNLSADIVTSSTAVRTSQNGITENKWNTSTNFHYIKNSDNTRSIYQVNYIQDDQFYRRYTTGYYVSANSNTSHSLATTVSYSDFKNGTAETQGSCKFNEFVLQNGIDTAVNIAKNDDYAVVVVGNNPMVNARESQDRPGLALAPKQMELVHKVAAANPKKTIVIIKSSYPFAVDEIQNDPNVGAILYTTHAGQAEGTALANVIFGNYAPAGCLTATWLKDESSLPQMRADADTHDPQYTVDMLEDDALQAKLSYRYSDAIPTYAFGYGLNYTNFAYSNLSVPGTAKDADTVNVGFDVKNTGMIKSDTVAQIYMHSRNSAYGNNVAKKQLIGFMRVKDVEPGETRHVTIPVKMGDMFVWDAVTQSKIVETGDYDVMVGAASNDIRLNTILSVNGKTIGTLNLSSPKNAWENYTISRGVTHWKVSAMNAFRQQGNYYSVGSVQAGDYIGFKKVNMNLVDGINLNVSTSSYFWANVANNSISVFADAPTNAEGKGQLLGTLQFGPTGDQESFVKVSGSLKKLSGIHDLYLVFGNGGIYLEKLQLTTSVPEVSNAAVTPDNGKLIVAWTDPAYSALDKVKISVDGIGSVIVGKGVQKATIGALKNGLEYVVRVSAVEQTGNESLGVEVKGTPHCAVKSVDLVYIATAAGTPPVLPKTVAVTCEDGSRLLLNTVWEDVTPESYVQAGSFVVKGSVTGTTQTLEAKANVTVTNMAAATLSVSASATTTGAGAAFMITYGLMGVKDITLQDITLSYNTDLFEFTGAIPSTSQASIEWVDNDTSAGKITLKNVSSSFTAYGAITGTVNVAKVNFKTKAKGTGIFTVEDGTWMRDVGGHKFYPAKVSTTVSVDADKDMLTTAIGNAQAVYDNAAEGISEGQYPAGMKDQILKAAITNATVVMDSTGSTVQQIAQAIADLNTAANKLKSCVITNKTGDINGLSGCDTVDLRLVENYFGTRNGDLNWDAIKNADINGDGKIGLYELAFIVRKILDWNK